MHKYIYIERELLFKYYIIQNIDNGLHLIIVFNLYFSDTFSVT